ncbi:hypothetical protein ACP70R_038246 [Stipagrostis hirtigluma subsp. patula]
MFIPMTRPGKKQNTAIGRGQSTHLSDVVTSGDFLTNPLARFATHVRLLLLPGWTLGQTCQRSDLSSVASHITTGSLHGLAVARTRSLPRRQSHTHTHTCSHATPRMAHGAGGDEAAAGAWAWRGSVRAVAAGPTPDEAWALLGEFCALDRWVPSVRTCRRVEGAEGRPGCVRYCAGPVNMARPAPGGEEGEAAAAAAGWSKERLVEWDPAARRYSYEVVESNKGFGRYRAAVRVEDDPAGCAVAWSFEADPAEGWTLEGFVGFLDKLARGVAKRLEEEVAAK